MFVPSKGDVIWLSFDPSTGTEITKKRPALVISEKAFNEYTHFAIVAPITSKVRGIKLEVLLPKTMQTKGSVLMYQIKSLDFANREAKLIEKAPKEVIEMATRIANLITK